MIYDSFWVKGVAKITFCINDPIDDSTELGLYTVSFEFPNKGLIFPALFSEGSNGNAWLLQVLLVPCSL